MTKITIITPGEYIVSKWSGGTTTQLAINPSDAIYAERDFIWRLSSAGVDLDESTFTSLPDYNRIIATLHGDMTLVHDAGPEISLKPYQVHSFDGASDTKSFGRCTDFNLMLRKGVVKGSVRHIHAEKGGKIYLTVPQGGTTAVFCAVGEAVSGEYKIKARDTLLAVADDECTICLDCREDADFMAAFIEPENT